MHQAVFQILYPIFDKKFIFDSYSCRDDKGTHRGVLRLKSFSRYLSCDYKRNFYGLKCDVKKFFDNIDHQVLKSLIRQEIKDESILWLVDEIINSFSKSTGRGLPLGNVTSQLFANTYLHQFDLFVKDELEVKYYLRYCDDFIILSKDKSYLLNLINQIDSFLKNNLKLQIHENKINLRKLSQGFDFLGYVVLPHYTVLRTKTKRRILKEIKNNFNPKALPSYLGMLKHCSGFKIRRIIIHSIVAKFKL